MKRIYRGPGHGVSIGSLGKDNSADIVTKVVVLDTALLRETTNGVRIETWQGGSGYVRRLRFENVRIELSINSTVIRRKPAKTRYQQCKQARLCTGTLVGQQKARKQGSLPAVKQYKLREEGWHREDLLQRCSRLWLWDR
ncbi:hypothetical protein V6N13_135021 [Hibiscus sabdariffa]|uniref:Polygalacturonase n=1 Tax=Hibiscus sabdariffa TaxID=183260 RepID=A0ABR2R5Y1_9ROSI